MSLKKYFKYHYGMLCVGKSFVNQDWAFVASNDSPYPYAYNGIIAQLYHPTLFFKIAKTVKETYDKKAPFGFVVSGNHFNFMISGNSCFRICLGKTFFMFAAKFLGFGIGVAFKNENQKNNE